MEFSSKQRQLLLNSCRDEVDLYQREVGFPYRGPPIHSGIFPECMGFNSPINPLPTDFHCNSIVEIQNLVEIVAKVVILIYLETCTRVWRITFRGSSTILVW